MWWHCVPHVGTHAMRPHPATMSCPCELAHTLHVGTHAMRPHPAFQTMTMRKPCYGSLADALHASLHSGSVSQHDQL